MQAPILTEEELTTHYVSVAKWLYEISRTYFFLGRREDCQRLLRTSLHLLETEGARPEQRLKLLLLYGQVLLVEHLLTRGEADLLFATLRQAREIADMVQDRQGSADALSMLGQAYCFTTTVASLQSGLSPFAPKGEGRYDEELTRALAYQQQALKKAA